MYCKLFIDCGDRDKILSILKNHFGNCKSRFSDHSFADFDIHIIRNKESLPETVADINDRFLYYPIIADLDIDSDYIEITDKIIRIIKNENIRIVAACDYEDELKKEN